MAKIKAVEQTAWEKVMVAVKKSVEFVNKLIATRPKLAVVLAAGVGVVFSEPVKIAVKGVFKLIGLVFALVVLLGQTLAQAQSANGVPGAAATPYYRTAIGAIGPDGKLSSVRVDAYGAVYTTNEKPVVSPTPTWNATTTPTQPPTSTPTATNTPIGVTYYGDPYAYYSTSLTISDNNAQNFVTLGNIYDHWQSLATYPSSGPTTAQVIYRQVGSGAYRYAASALSGSVVLTTDAPASVVAVQLLGTVTPGPVTVHLVMWKKATR